MKTVGIDVALTDSRLLGAGLGDATTWATWLVVLKAAFGHPLDAAELQLFKSVAGNRAPPTARVRELWCCVSRRGGKSRMAAALCVYLALFQKHRLSPGESGQVQAISATTDQAKVVFNYALAFLRGSPVLRKEIVSYTKNEIRLRNGITIVTHSNSFRTVRGISCVGCVLDEVSFFRDETAAASDKEVYTAVLPSLLTTNGMLVAISSPYRKSGLLYLKFKQYFGVDSNDTLFVQGSSRTFNATLNEAAIAAQRDADPTAASSEWDGEFRVGLTGYLDDEVIDAAIDRDRPIELPPQAGCYYKAYTDCSGGAVNGDSYTLAIAHKQGGRFIVDVVRGKQGPFEPNELTEDYARLLRDYHVYAVSGDYYSAEWASSAWRKHRVSYNKALIPASQTYIEALPLFTRGLVSLPDHPVLLRELRLLERTPQRLGREQVTHPRGAHDDYANAVAGVLRLLAGSGYSLMYEDEEPEPKTKFTRAPEPDVSYGPFTCPFSKLPLEYKETYLANLPYLPDYLVGSVFYAAPAQEPQRSQFLQYVSAALINTPAPNNADIERAITAAGALARATQAA